MQISREWLDLISDDQGLTNGQQKLLTIWCKAAEKAGEFPVTFTSIPEINRTFTGIDYVDKLIPDRVAHFLEHCRGYREMPQHVRDFKGWPQHKMDVPTPRDYDHAIHKGPDHA